MATSKETRRADKVPRSPSTAPVKARRATRGKGRKRTSTARKTAPAKKVFDVLWGYASSPREAVAAVCGVQIKDTNPKDAAASTRLDLSLFPMSAIAHGAHAMAEGNLKYGGYNWREAGVLASVYVAAGMRHLFKFFNGQDHDPKTLVHELGSVMACCGILIDAIESGKLVDDRPPSQDMAAMLDRFEEKIKHLHTVFPPAKSPGRYTQKRRAA